MESPADRTKTIEFPPDMQEEQVRELLANLIRSLDREKLRTDPRMPIARHPLLVERLGQDMPIDVLITNLIEDVVTSLALERAGLRREDPWLKHGAVAESALLRNSADSDICNALLGRLKETAKALSDLNDASAGSVSAVPVAIGGMLNKMLRMPTIAQNFVLYPAVRREGFGATRSAILASVESTRRALAAQFGASTLEGKDDIIRSIEDEAAAVAKWYGREDACPDVHE